MQANVGKDFYTEKCEWYLNKLENYSNMCPEIKDAKFDVKVNIRFMAEIIKRYNEYLVQNEIIKRDTNIIGLNSEKVNGILIAHRQIMLKDLNELIKPENVEGDSYNKIGVDEIKVGLKNLYDAFTMNIEDALVESLVMMAASQSLDMFIVEIDDVFRDYMSDYIFAKEDAKWKEDE